MKEAFAKVDKSSEGKITYAQMRPVLQDYLDEKPMDEAKDESTDDLLCWFVDYNEDKMISYEELLLFLFNTDLGFEDFAKAAFRMCDINGDGFVDRKEIHAMFRLGRKAGQGSAKDCRVLVAMFDEDDDCKLNYDEFCNMIKEGTILDSDSD